MHVTGRTGQSTSKQVDPLSQTWDLQNKLQQPIGIYVSNSCKEQFAETLQLTHMKIMESHGKSSGWWLTCPSEKYEFVSWDDEIPNWMERHKIPWFQTTNQS